MLHGAVKKGKTCEMILQSQTFGGGSMRLALFVFVCFLYPALACWFPEHGIFNLVCRYAEHRILTFFRGLHTIDHAGQRRQQYDHCEAGG